MCTSVFFLNSGTSGSSVKQGTVHRGDRDSRNGCNSVKNPQTQQFTSKKASHFNCRGSVIFSRRVIFIYF